MSTMYAFAKEVAAELGLEWEVVPADPERDWTTHHPTIRRGPDGPSFWIGNGYHSKGKITVHPHWPLDGAGKEMTPRTYSNESSPSISFSDSKPAATAARDIARRFLPDFLTLWNTLKERADADKNYREYHKVTAEKIATILGGTVSRPGDSYAHGNDALTVVRLGHRTHGITDVKIHSDYVELEVRCTVEMVKFIAALFPPHKDESAS